MNGAQRPPLIDEDGEVREITDEDMADGLRVADFGSLEAAEAEALRRRDLRESGRQPLTVYLDPAVRTYLQGLGPQMDEAVNAAVRKAAGL